MSEPTRIRAQATGDKATVRILMNHEMESGHRKDAAGKVVPAWHIQDVEVRLNGRIVLTAEWGGGVSKNPFLQFTARGTRVGDRLSVTWRDNRGDTRTDETLIT